MADHVEVFRFTSARSVGFAGSAFSCGLRGGRLLCWGRNEDGQCGNGTIGGRTLPARLGVDSDWTAVSAGDSHACGIRQGELYCWGANAAGQLGNGTTLASGQPVPVLR